MKSGMIIVIVLVIAFALLNATDIEFGRRGPVYVMMGVCIVIPAVLGLLILIGKYINKNDKS